MEEFNDNCKYHESNSKILENWNELGREPEELDCLICFLKDKIEEKVRKQDPQVELRDLPYYSYNPRDLTLETSLDEGFEISVRGDFIPHWDIISQISTYKSIAFPKSAIAIYKSIDDSTSIRVSWKELDTKE